VYGSQKTTAFYLSELKCENLINPLGIDNVTPHFSWKLKGNGWKGGQTYYEIQVASDSILLTQDRADLWNTGKLKSNVSVMVPYQGKALTSRSLCYWRVRVWDAKKQVSSWSPVARFGVGILNKSQMQGDYIGASIEGDKICAPILRKKVKLTQGETSFLHNIDMQCLRFFRQSRHTKNFSGNGYNHFSSVIDNNIFNMELEVVYRTINLWIGRK